jgi:DNA polymerase-3 subunit chi
MTDVAFHFGAEDKLGYCCRLLRKASVAGAIVTVVAPQVDLNKIDAGLWAVSPTDFIPHCEVNGPQSQLGRSTIHLTCDMSKALGRNGVLLNLCGDVPDGFEAFDRVIEVVSTDDLDREKARQRWKHYKNKGYSITRHDLATKGQAA